MLLLIHFSLSTEPDKNKITLRLNKIQYGVNEKNLILCMTDLSTDSKTNSLLNFSFYYSFIITIHLFIIITETNYKYQLHQEISSTR